MVAGFVITLRETLEAALVVGIMLAYLNKIGQKKYSKYVWLGTAAGILASIITAVAFTLFAAGFTGRAEEIFEGTTMIIAAVLITTMIFWMSKQKNKIRKNIENKVSVAIKKEEKMELFMLPFVAVLREGVETVIFLTAATFAGAFSIIFSILGVIVALIIGYLLFAAAKKMNLKHFFNATSLLLILFSAGLVAHGIHEFQEAGLAPVGIEHIWDTNHILDENGLVGSFMKALLGYNANPSLIEVLAYFIYLGAIVIAIRMTSRKHSAA